MARWFRGALAGASALTVAAIVLTACNPDGPDGPSATVGSSAATPTAVTAPAAVGLAPSVPADTQGAVEPNGEVVAVAALDNSFVTQTIEIAAGTEVRWENRGRNEHDVLPVDAGQDWGADNDVFHPGDEYARVFDTPGTYPYYCSIHGTPTAGMIGTIVVLPADG